MSKISIKEGDQNLMLSIDVTKELSKEDFCSLFEQHPLEDDERDRVANEYWGMYEAFQGNEVKPEDCWLAVRNIFVIKESQIGDRIIKALEESKDI